jgi:hypothetical protein
MKETIKEKMMNLVTISNDRIKEEAQMKNKRNIYMLNLISLVILSLTFISTAQAQSTSQSNPTSITMNEITAKGPSKETNYYYSFTGGPGEVTIMLNIKAKQYSTFARLEVLDSELNRLATHNMNAASSTGPEQVIKKIELSKKQTVLLKFTLDGNLAEYKIRLGGAVELGSPSSDNSSFSTGNMTNQSANKDKISNIDFSKNKLGQFINLPNSGTLVIQMNDGTTQEINLKNVKNVMVKP